MKRIFAAWLTIMSIATVVKFINMISATGRMPTRDAPIAAPMIACSEMGVERTRALPNFSDKPLVVSTTPPPSRRSEEHTSELQSLMRTSYAVFCLKKNKQILIEHHRHYSYHHITHTRLLQRDIKH